MEQRTYTPCGGLNENGTIGLCLNTWLQYRETIWEGAGGVALLEVCHWEWALRFQKPMPFHVSSLCLLRVDLDLTSHQQL